MQVLYCTYSVRYVERYRAMEAPHISLIRYKVAWVPTLGIYLGLQEQRVGQIRLEDTLDTVSKLPRSLLQVCFSNYLRCKVRIWKPFGGVHAAHPPQPSVSCNCRSGRDSINNWALQVGSGTYLCTEYDSVCKYLYISLTLTLVASR